jgi:hypothetical protein
MMTSSENCSCLGAQSRNADSTSSTYINHIKVNEISKALFRNYYRKGRPFNREETTCGGVRLRLHQPRVALSCNMFQFLENIILGINKVHTRYEIPHDMRVA